MAADFVRSLLGYVGSKPNTADGSSKQSVAIADGVLKLLDVSHQAPGRQAGGTALENGVAGFLRSALPAADPTRPWSVRRGGKISDFQQYAHLGDLDRLVQNDTSDLLRVEIGQDYLISPDVTVGLEVARPPILHAAVS